MRLDPNLIYPGKDLDFTFPEEGSDLMTYQEILEGITRHRANPPTKDNLSEFQRKINEIEWALQALAEKLRDQMEGPA